jgi:hypothetical protein
MRSHCSLLAPHSSHSCLQFTSDQASPRVPTHLPCGQARYVSEGGDGWAHHRAHGDGVNEGRQWVVLVCREGMQGRGEGGSDRAD